MSEKAASSDCAKCVSRGKPENFGSDPKCAFRQGVFSSDNWNCATANKIRSICNSYDYADLPLGVRRLLHEDENYALILVVDCPRPDDTWFGDTLYVQWYKSRGCTADMVLLGKETRPPTEAECLAIIDHYQARELWPNGHPDDEEELTDG